VVIQAPWKDGKKVEKERVGLLCSRVEFTSAPEKNKQQTTVSEQKSSIH